MARTKRYTVCVDDCAPWNSQECRKADTLRQARAILKKLRRKRPRWHCGGIYDGTGANARIVEEL